MSMIEEYQQAGFTCIEGLFNKDEVHDLQLATDELIEESRNHITSDEKFDLEHNHSSQIPRVQRIKVPHKQHPVFAAAVRNPQILEILSKLIGENIRFRNNTNEISIFQNRKMRNFEFFHPVQCLFSGIRMNQWRYFFCY